MDKKKFAFPIYVSAALTWFGYHCGSGFASGRQVYLYAAKFGTAGWLAIVFAWICCAAFITIAMEYARTVKAKSYRDVVSGIYIDNKPFAKGMLLVWDLMIFGSMLTASSACVAGCGTLLNELFGLPYFVGCAAFVILMLVIMAVGEGALDRLSNISSPLIILFVIVAVTGITYGAGNLGRVLTTDLGNAVEGNPTTLDIIKSGFTYGCIQISVIHTMSVYGGKFEKRSDSVKAGVIGFVMNAGAMLLSFFAIMAYYPEICEAPMPILDIVKSVPGAYGGVLMIMYNFILVMAYITTAGALIAGGIARYTPILGKKLSSPFACRVAIVLVVLIGASLLSILGLDGVLTTAYGFLSNLRKPIWFFPIIILGPISIYRETKRRAAQKTEG